MIYVFDDCTINTRLYTLQRAGRTTRLRPKVFQVLLYLLEHRDSVVSKQELAEQVWPDQFIADSTLESTVRAMRQVLGDSGREQRLIQTLPGHGYRFIGRITAHVEEQDSDDVQAEATASPAAPLQDGDDTQGDRLGAEYGAHVQSHCPRCGIENSPVANFCSSCGLALTEPPSTSGPFSLDPSRDLMPGPLLQPDPPSSRRDASEAERRQLTVMSCDLVDAATLPGQLDLEDLRDVTRAYQDTCAAVAQRFGGHIAQRLGNKLLIYFGYPVAHEDDAQRAVSTGLGIIQSLEALNARLAQEKSVRLAVRLGIHTGLVVVEHLDGGDRQETVAFGEPPNVAEQIQGLAPPDTVVISAATAHLVQGYFSCRDVGLHRLEGVAEPVRLSRVVAASGAQSRLDIVSTAGLTPFVGRDIEIALLLERWAQVQYGSGHVVLLSGEAGIGKSRLVRVMQDHLAEDTYIPLYLRCLPHYQHSALYPVIDFFHRWVLQWHQDDTPKEKLNKLETALAPYAVPLDDTVPLLAALLSLPCPGERYPPLQLTPQQQREKTLGAILTVVLALASHQPVLLIVEDLHWLDPSTLELLNLLVDQTPTAPLCTLLTFRPTFDVPWGNRSYMTHVTLSRLPRQQVEQMVTRVTGGKPLPAELLQQVVDQTDGVPLFVEECTKSILETGLLEETADHYELTEPLPALTIPTTLHDSLMARLDRLDTAKSVAQLGATIGRHVPYAILQAVWQQDDTILQRELERLVEAELVYQRGLLPQATYVFKHALIQEAAYQSLLRNTRQNYHQRIAQALADQFPTTIATQPELLAHHYTEAGLHQQAIPYWQRAGELALERSANIEAISHLTQGLTLLEALPTMPERAHHELALQLTLGAPLQATKGSAAPEVEAAYVRAYELCQEVGTSAQRFVALQGLFFFHFTRGEFRKAQELGEQCLTLAQDMQDLVVMQETHMILGSNLLFMGQPAEAHAHLEQSINLFGPQRCHAQAVSLGYYPEVMSLSRAAWALWMRGYPDRALARGHEALAVARETGHAHSLVFAINHLGGLHQYRREAQLVQEQAELMIALSQEQGFAYWLSGALIMRGWALAEQGASEEGIEQFRQGLTTRREQHAVLGLTRRLVRYAEVHRHVGQVDAALGILDEALEVMHKSEEHQYASEIYRLKGELMLQRARGRHEVPTRCVGASILTEVETCFSQALEITRHQQAKSLELRATMNLSCLWWDLDKQAAARQLLTEVYDWFTEGFDTLDLQEAKALLDAWG